MFRLINVSADYGRLKNAIRTRFVERGRKIVFSWGALSDRKDAVQSACRIRLSSKDFAWDSGWTERKEQFFVYEGTALPEGEPIVLNLCIRDDAGMQSEEYTQTFYNASVDWKAGWIGASEQEGRRTIYFRREINISRPLESAVLYACGIGYQKLYANGIAIDDAALDPANTDYSKTCQYVMYPEFKQYLREGVNCIGALVGNGWRRNCLVPDDGALLHEDMTRRPLPYAGKPIFSAMLKLTYQGNDIEWINTDDAWQWGYGAHDTNDIFDGETYDANLSAIGWSEPGFAFFTPAAIAAAPGGQMRPMVLNPIVEHGTFPAIACWPIGQDSVIVDFGQNRAGVCRLHLPANMKKGQRISISHAEELDEDGTLYTAPLRRAAATDIYIASGDDRDLTKWQPIFTYHSFRYARIDGLGAGFDPADIVAVDLHTDLETRSTFRCGDAQVTKIHEACVATERANQHSILTDCPQRDERQGWMNDATVRFEETPYNFDVGRMFPKLIRDIIDEQNELGAITCTAPFVFGNQPADPVCSSFLVAGMES